MLHTILPGEHANNLELIESMFRMRDRVVVGEWGWDIPGATPGRENDQFDTDKTAYFVVTANEEAAHFGQSNVIACARLNPTTAPHMMSELYASLCNLQECPVGPNVWECSRYFSDNRACGDSLAAKRARTLVNLAMLKFAVDSGIDTFVWLIHQMIYGHMIKAWESEPLGTPHRSKSDDYAWIPGRSMINQDAITRVSQTLASIDMAIAKSKVRSQRMETARA